MPPERHTGPHTCGMVCWHVRRGVTRLRGVPPSSWTASPTAPGGGKRTRRVYMEGILPLVWPGCCSKVFLWADLTQPGGYVHFFKARPRKVKGVDPMVKRYSVRRDGVPRGVAMPPERHTGTSYMRDGVLACPKGAHASPGCAPPPSRTAPPPAPVGGETDA